jgi:hypothetical protein
MSPAEDPQPGAWLEPQDFERVVRCTPLVSIDIVVRSKDGQVLLGRRKNEPARNSFFVPGDRITKNERLEAAFRRITLAELGFPMELARPGSSASINTFTARTFWENRDSARTTWSSLTN